MRDAIQQQTQTMTRPDTLQITQHPGRSFIIPSEHSEITRRWKNQAPPGVLQRFKLCGNKSKKSLSQPRKPSTPQKIVPQVKILDCHNTKEKQRPIFTKTARYIVIFFFYIHWWIMGRNDRITVRRAAVMCLWTETKTIRT